ncbi:Uncharacterised protein [uncultured archaeon]|nr:Uncharacterised protein [uncultured archaeon]
MSNQLSLALNSRGAEVKDLQASLVKIGILSPGMSLKNKILASEPRMLC